MSSSYRIELDRWLSQLNVTADTVLDIGGSQLPVKGRTLSWNVQQYLIADLPEPHIGSPKPDLELDLNEVYEDGVTCPASAFEHYDLIFCLEVFDYIWNTRDAFGIIAIRLRKNGTAWVTFPSQYPTHQPVEDDALRYMPGGIKKLAEASGLKIVQMIPRRTETDAIYQAFRTERMRCAKHEDHNISGWIVEFTK